MLMKITLTKGEIHVRLQGLKHKLRKNKFSATFAFSAVALIGVILILLIIRCRFKFFARDAIPLLDPRAEVDELAAFGAERSVRIIVPLSFMAARRTLNPTGHGRPL